jgi:folate-binding Fe-S cluster repair protein YgfZ
MSHEFELHHLVSELVSLLQVSETADVDAQVELLNKNRTPHITNQVRLLGAKVNQPTQHAVVQKYAVQAQRCREVFCGGRKGIMSQLLGVRAPV